MPRAYFYGDAREDDRPAEEELYDLKNDLGATTNGPRSKLWSSWPRTVRKLTNEMPHKPPYRRAENPPFHAESPKDGAGDPQSQSHYRPVRHTSLKGFSKTGRPSKLPAAFSQNALHDVTMDAGEAEAAALVTVG